MIDVDARGRHEAERLRKEAARIADTEAALQSVLADEVVVPLEPNRPAPSRPPVARRRVSTRRRVHLVAGGLVAAGLVAVLALVVRNGGEGEPAVAPPAENGLIAFVGESADNRSRSDIYVVAPDGTGLRPLTSTPGFAEFAPAWSPDGSRLAFVRTDDVFSNSSLCASGCQLVVVDPSTGVETFSADIPNRAREWSVPRFLAWSPDGRAIVIPLKPCGIGGCGPGNDSVIADLGTGAFTTFTPPSPALWSPDGEWLLVGSLLVPADLIGPGDVVDITELPGVRLLPVSAGDVEWMPDGSAMVVSSGRIDVVTVADGERRTVIEGGFDPVVSPDGGQIAYLRRVAPLSKEEPGEVKEIWVAAADGSDPRRVADSLTPPAWSPDGSLLLAGDADGWFTVRPDGTDRAALGVRDHTPRFLEGVISGRVDWQSLPPGSVAGLDDRRVGFVGVPPAGASPSTPERGELVVYLAGPEVGSRTWVYADGRMIWHRYADLPEGANSEFTGFLEQRLTPEGVELVRSEVVSLGLLEPSSSRSRACSWYLCEILVREGGVLRRVDWPSGAVQPREQITDLASWLPASAWEDPEIKAYVPSSYDVGVESGDLDLLPGPARDLLEDRTLTFEEARVLDQALADAGIGRDSPHDGHRGRPDPWSLIYRIDRSGDDTPGAEERYIMLEPYLPHGEAYCQHCG